MERLQNCFHVNLKEITDIDAIIFAVPHQEFKTIKLESLKKMYRKAKNVNADLMGESLQQLNPAKLLKLTTTY